MQQAMLTCKGVQTPILTEGRWVEEGLDPDGHKDLVLIIPGNPGIPGFYADFAKAVKSKLPSETPVWVLGHAGHVQPPEDLNFSPKHLGFDRYNLEGQAQRKIEFLNEYVPKDAKIHIIGHSIGSWFALQLLDDPDYTEQIQRCYLLFPTIERMAESPSGKFLNSKVMPIAQILVFGCWLLSFLPVMILMFLIRIFGGFFAGVTSRSVKPVVQLLNPSVLRRVLRLARDELIKVKQRDDELIERHENKIWLYYGATDGWTPLKYFDELTTRHPGINAQVCGRGIRHAFVLQDKDKELGQMIGEMINKTIH